MKLTTKRCQQLPLKLPAVTAAQMFSCVHSSCGAAFCVWSEVIADRAAISLTITDGDRVWQSTVSTTAACSSSSSGGDAAPVFDSSFITYTAKPANRRESWSCYLAILEGALSSSSGVQAAKRFDYQLGIAETAEGDEASCLSVSITEILPVVPAQRIRLLHNFRLPLSAEGGKGALLRFIGLLGDRYNESKSELKRESERNDRISKNNDFLFNELSNYKEAKEKTQDDLFRKFALILTEKREASNFSSSSSSMPRLQETPKRRGGMLIGEMPESEDAPPPKRRGSGIVIGGTTVQVLSGSDEVDMHLSQQAPPAPAPKPAPSPSVSQAESAVGGRRRGFFAR